MHTCLSKHLLLFVQLLYINYTLKKCFEKNPTVCNRIAEYAAHVFYLVILALRLLDDICWHVGENPGLLVLDFGLGRGFFPTSFGF